MGSCIILYLVNLCVWAWEWKHDLCVVMLLSVDMNCGLGLGPSLWAWVGLWVFFFSSFLVENSTLSVETAHSFLRGWHPFWGVSVGETNLFVARESVEPAGFENGTDLSICWLVGRWSNPSFCSSHRSHGLNSERKLMQWITWFLWQLITNWLRRRWRGSWG